MTKENKIITAKNKDKAGKSGTIEAIISALQTHTMDAEISKVGCELLRSITEDNGKNTHIFFLSLSTKKPF